MKKINKLIETLVFAAILLVSTFSFVAFSNPVAAQLASVQPSSGALPTGATADFTVTTTPYINVRPSVVGLGQTVLVNIWLLPAPNAHRLLLDMKVTITAPDGTQEVLTMESYPADGTAWFEWVVDQLGEWKFKFDFPGMYYPAGRYLDGNIITASTGGTVYTSAYYKPSSTGETTITVQNDWVSSLPAAQMPSDYWTRPVSFDNREWWTISGAYPWYGPVGAGSVWDELYPGTSKYWGDRFRFTPWVQGPNTAHIAWKRTDNLGGLMQFGDKQGPFTLTNAGGVPSIIYMGRCYQGLTKTTADGSATTVLQCYDIRTGEIYWERKDVPAPTIIEYDQGTPETAGGEARQMGNTGAVYLVYIGGGRLIKYNPSTGATVGNYSIDPLTGTGGTYYKNGYVLGIQNLGTNVSADQRYRLINWTTIGTSATLAARVKDNSSFALASFPSVCDWNELVGVTMSKSMVSGAPNMTTVTAFSLKTGAQMWSQAVPEWTYSGSCAVADHGKIAVLMEQGYWMAWDIKTGSLAWKSEAMAYPWGEPAFGAYSVQSAYGMLFRESYDGVYAFDWDTGKIVWKYVAPAASPFETPYVDESGGQTVLSFDSHANILDGKMYTLNNEHTPTSPITRGWGVHCINITDGTLIWKMQGPWAWAAPGPAADGYLTVASADGVMYVYGKGQSETNVEAPANSIGIGEKVIIQGTVLDQSPAQPGTPCVSKDSMATQMEYLHIQHPIDGFFHNQTITGVPVSLDAVDPNGNSVHIGDVTTDGYSGTFGFEWQPETAGMYQITATFMGDDSYGSSFATTYATVSQSTEQPQTPTASINFESVNNTTITAVVGTGIAIIVAIAVVGLLVSRKKP
ncbi:MAG: PQQ-binding-like beta-propeller repeat protein [Candidatus Bathyarchaeia archaeon]